MSLRKGVNHERVFSLLGMVQTTDLLRALKKVKKLTFFLDNG